MKTVGKQVQRVCVRRCRRRHHHPVAAVRWPPVSLPPCRRSPKHKLPSYFSPTIFPQTRAKFKLGAAHALESPQAVWRCGEGVGVRVGGGGGGGRRPLAYQPTPPSRQPPGTCWEERDLILCGGQVPPAPPPPPPPSLFLLLTLNPDHPAAAASHSHPHGTLARRYRLAPSPPFPDPAIPNHTTPCLSCRPTTSPTTTTLIDGRRSQVGFVWVAG